MTNEELQDKALRGAELTKTLVGQKGELYRYVLVHGDKELGYLASSEEWISPHGKYPEFSEVLFVTPFFDTPGEAEADAMPDAIKSAQKDGFLFVTSFFDSPNEAEADAMPDAIKSAQKDGFQLVGKNSARGFFDKLVDFQISATPKTFDIIFGNSGKHIWEKFQKHDANIISLYLTLDSKNKMLLTDYVERWI